MATKKAEATQKSVVLTTDDVAAQIQDFYNDQLASYTAERDALMEKQQSAQASLNEISEDLTEKQKIMEQLGRLNAMAQAEIDRLNTKIAQLQTLVNAPVAVMFGEQSPDSAGLPSPVIPTTLPGGKDFIEKEPVLTDTQV